MTPRTMRLHLLGTTLAAGALSLTGTMASADQVFFDDVIVVGSLCAGQDCVNGESFGFDTVRLKENNLRLHFDDTSTSASFPSNDWRITANDSANGGASYLGIEDATAGRFPFRVLAGAAANSLYVDAQGDVGMGNGNPVVELHVTDGDSPTVRLEQDGSSGFTPQTWDMAGNEANFFIRDVTNGSQLPFRIAPGADTNSISISATNNVGMGVQNPDASLHVRRSDGTAKLLVQEASTTAAARVLAQLENNGVTVLQMTDTGAGGGTWNLQNRGATNGNDFRIVNSVTAGEEFILTQTGNLTISGDITSGGTTNVPDYVFAPDYELMPLHEVEAFIVENQHLPKIPSAADVAANGLNMNEMQMALLEKVEELTLYTLEQQKTIDALQTRLETLAD